MAALPACRRNGDLGSAPYFIVVVKMDKRSVLLAALQSVDRFCFFFSYQRQATRLERAQGCSAARPCVSMVTDHTKNLDVGLLVDGT
jgi:hypothetical protein